MIDLNQIPYLLENKGISQKEAINSILEFVNHNLPLFNLDIYDEDFQSEIYIKILENGEKMLKTFDADCGNFFSYFYCCIISLISTQIRKEAVKAYNLIAISDECIKNYEEKMQSYEYQNNFNEDLYCCETPFEFKKAKLSINTKKSHLSQKDKTLLVIALKSSFFISDSQIKKIADLYNLSFEDLYNVIQNIKSDLLKKYDRKSKYEERRNRAYYYHVRYSTQINKIHEEKDEIFKEALLTDLTKRNEIQERRWKAYNSKLQKGFIHIRPSNKTVAEILGICERQVSYYLFCCKNDKNIQDYSEKYNIVE